MGDASDGGLWDYGNPKARTKSDTVSRGRDGMTGYSIVLARGFIHGHWVGLVGDVRNVRSTPSCDRQAVGNFATYRDRQGSSSIPRKAFKED